MSPRRPAPPSTPTAVPPLAGGAGKASTDETPAGRDTVETLARIGPIARSSVVDAVADRLRDQILAGRLEPGARLPSEREFALALGVNRLTLRAALARLEALGLVMTRHGAGTVVASWRERAGLEALAALVGSNHRDSGAYRELLTAMLEVRRILASEAIALAAERHTAEDIEVMKARAAEQPSRVHDAVAFARGDISFQRAIVRAGRNVGLELLLNTFARFPEEQPQLVAQLYDRREESLTFYPLVIGLVQQRDPVAARQAMREALSAIDEAWQERHFGAGGLARSAAGKKRK